MKQKKEKIRTATKINFTDEQSDEFGGIQILSDATLAKVARGEIDLNQIAINYLAGRGMDENGKCIGFEAAKQKFLK